MKITFFSPCLGLRGTEVTMYDYAFYGRQFFNWDVNILYNKNHPLNDITAIDKFKNQFDVFSISASVENMQDCNHKVENFLSNQLDKSDFFYVQKKGLNDGLCPKYVKTCILCCSIVDPKKEKHGDSYAFISDWLSDFCSDGEVPVVPSIIDLPDINENMRQELNIPLDGIVFGRTGGMDTWNISFTNHVIAKILNEKKNIYFLFQNTPKIFNHPNVIYLPTTADLNFKTRFINTCDAFLHSRLEGESFGVACGEFSIRNKRVITYGGSPERNHICILKDKALYYNNGLELYKIIQEFKIDNSKDWNCYKDFNPRRVMDQFKKNFIK